ncbi:MAG: DUF3455 domain-containing protein [Pseudomonadota bacterium]
MKRLFAYSCAATALAVTVSACSTPAPAPAPAPVLATSPVTVPAQLEVPPGHKLSLETSATGVQVYVCAAAKSDPSTSEWRLKTPEAELFNVAGNKVGKHYFGPTWEAADHSQVVGEVKARQDDPRGAAIPWLLLSAKSNSGKGIFNAVRFIQRLATEAGKAPADGCSAATVGQEVRVPYKAIYRFFQAA